MWHPYRFPRTCSNFLHSLPYLGVAQLWTYSIMEDEQMNAHAFSHADLAHTTQQGA